MWKKLIITLMLSTVFCMGFSIKTVKAEDVTEEETYPSGEQYEDLVFTSDDISADLIYDYSITNSSGSTSSGTNYNYQIAPRSQVVNYTGYRGGTIYPEGWSVYDSSTSSSDYVLQQLSFITNAELYGPNYSNAPNMKVSNLKFVARVEMPNMEGMYYLGVDFYVGFVCSNTYLRAGSAYQSSRTITTSATTNSPLEVYTDVYGHSFQVYPMSDQTYTVNATSGGITNIMTYNVKHFRAYFDGAIYQDENVVEFNFAQYFLDHMTDLIGSGVYANGWSNTNPYFLNAFFTTQGAYYGEIPSDPTPTPTPYPGQDTQESINQGVNQIESQVSQIVDLLNPQATPIPTPPEFTVDETPLGEFESMTYPDISDGQPVFSTMWEVFSPLLPYVLVMGTSLILTFFIMWILRGGWL